MTSMNRPALGHRPPPVAFTDEHGRKCLRVPLDRHARLYAIVRECDYRAIRKAGATGVWCLNDNGSGQKYVRTSVTDRKGRNTFLQVGRLIAGAGSKSTIYYANKNRLDLRPENLHWHRRGNSKRCDLDVVARAADLREDREARSTLRRNRNAVEAGASL